MEAWDTKFYKKIYKVLLTITFIMLFILIAIIAIDYFRFKDYEEIKLYIQYIDYDNEKAYAFYSYHGNSDIIKLMSYSSSWEIGKELKGLINPNNINDVTTFTDLSVLPIIFTVFTFIPFVSYCIMKIAVIYRKRRNKVIKTKGKKIIAKVEAFMGMDDFTRSLISNDNMNKLRQKAQAFKILATFDGKKYYSTFLIGNVKLWKEKLEQEDYAIDVYILNYKYFVDYKSIHLGVFY